MDLLPSNQVPEEFYTQLHNLAAIQGDYGFSFIVIKSYIERFLQDLNTDWENDKTGKYKKKTIGLHGYLAGLMAFMTTNYLYIDCGD